MEHSQTVLKRFEHIEFLLLFRGWLSRNDLMDQFGVGEAAATRDFRHYKELCPGNMELNKATKRWEITTETFQPHFQHPANKAFAKLRNSAISSALGLTEGIAPPRLYLPSTELLATITRAISNKTAVKICYASASGETNEREVVPHSLVDNGIRWHVRSYDRKNGRFGDFVLGRISAAAQIPGKLSKEELADSDAQWNRIVRLELAPHPNPDNLTNKDALATEYGMKDGFLVEEVRAAVAGYWLRLWNVDCSDGHTLEGKEYQLCLKNQLALYDVGSAMLAPGYRNPNANIGAERTS